MADLWIDLAIPMLGILCGLISLALFKQADKIKTIEKQLQDLRRKE